MDTNTETAPAVKAGRREWLGLLVLALPALLLSMDLTVLHLALPHLAGDLQPSVSQQLWILDIYGFVLAGFLVTMGTLGDRIGRRKLLLIGGACFGLASIFAAYSTSAEMLIVARALLGVAGATLAPSTLALIMNMFKDPKQISVAIGVWTTCFVAGSVLGPIVGGLMLSAFWWGAVFLLAVPVMILLIIAGPKLLPEFRNPDAGRMDAYSVALSLLTVLPTIYGIKEVARVGWDALPIASVIVGVFFGVLFVLRQRRLAEPLLDLSLFRIRLLRSELTMGLFVGVVTGGALLLVNLQLQLVEGLSPWETGLWMVPSAIGMVITSQAATRMTKWIRPAYLMATGLALAVVGYMVLSQASATDSLVTVVIGAVLINGGVGPFMALGYGILLTSAPPEKAGSASGIAETSGEFGIAAGIAVLGSIATAVYRSEFSAPAGLTADGAAAAQESITNATAVAQQQSGPVAAELLTSAREAFTSGLNVVSVVAAILFAAFTVLSLYWFKQVPTTGGSEPDGQADQEQAAAQEDTRESAAAVS